MGQISAWVFSAALAGAALVANPARATETLADALVSAYNNSGLLDQNRALLRAADENVAQAAAVLLPVITWSGSFQQQFGVSESTASFGTFATTLDATQVNLQLVANWQVFDFGADARRRDAAKETVLATRAGLLSIEQQVLLRAVMAFMDVRADTETVAIRENNIRLLSEELRAAQDRFEVGEVTRTDVALAESALAAARSELAGAQSDLAQAREEFRAAVGRAPGRLVTPPRLPNLEQSIDRARDFAVRNHPDLRQAQHQVAANELLIMAATQDLKPTFNLQGSFSVTEEIDSADRVESGSVGVTVGGPIYQGGALSSLVRSAVAQRDASRGNLLVVRRDVSASVGNAFANLQAAGAQMQATERQIRAAQVAFDGVREEATLGARTTLDVLDAEQSLLDARAARVQAEAQRFVAAYMVLASMGLLTAEQLQLPVQIYDPSAYYNLVKDGAPAISKQGRQLDRVLRALKK